MLGSICCMQTYFHLEEVSRHCQSYLQRITTRKMTGKHLYTTIARERKKCNFFKNLTHSTIDAFKYPSALNIWAYSFEMYFLEHHRLLLLLRKRKKTSFKRRQLFARAKKVWSLLSMWKESSSSQNRKAVHTVTHRTTTIPSLITCSGKGNTKSVQ